MISNRRVHVAEIDRSQFLAKAPFTMLLVVYQYLDVSDSFRENFSMLDGAVLIRRRALMLKCTWLAKYSGRIT